MKDIYRSRLPHMHPIGATFFVTFNLKGAIPKSVIEMLQQQKATNLAIIKAEKDIDSQQKLIRAHKLHFKHFEQYLDNAPAESPMWLREEKIANIIKKALKSNKHKAYIIVLLVVLCPIMFIY